MERRTEEAAAVLFALADILAVVAIAVLTDEERKRLRAS